MNSLVAEESLGETDASKPNPNENQVIFAMLGEAEKKARFYKAELDKERDSRLERVIRCCRESGVLRLIQGDLTVEFYVLPAATETPAAVGVQPLPVFVPAEDGDEEKEAEGSFVPEEIREELRLNDLMVNDPAAYEQEMIDALNFKGDE